ncbi:MAG: hypothetical protein ABFR97_02950 [Thermodesulfobacteriota bacterium]
MSPFKPSSKFFFFLSLCLLLLSSQAQASTERERQLKMLEMLDKLDQLDKLDFDEAIYQADHCTIKRNFSCAERQLVVAQGFISNASGDEDKLQAAKERLRAERRAQQREEDELERLREEEERLREEMEEEAEYYASNQGYDDDYDPNQDMMNYMAQMGQEVANFKAQLNRDTNAAIQQANEIHARQQRQAEAKARRQQLAYAQQAREQKFAAQKRERERRYQQRQEKLKRQQQQRQAELTRQRQATAEQRQLLASYQQSGQDKQPTRTSNSTSQTGGEQSANRRQVEQVICYKVSNSSTSYPDRENGSIAAIGSAKPGGGLVVAHMEEKLRKKTWNQQDRSWATKHYVIKHYEVMKRPSAGNAECGNGSMFDSLDRLYRHYRDNRERIWGAEVNKNTDLVHFRLLK